VIDQLTGVTGYETPSGTQRKHENLTFAYDAAGNLTQRNNNALVETFTFGNSLNQPTSATTSGTLTVAGMTTGGATSVTVNSSSATPYSDGSYAVQGLALTSSYTASTTLGGETATDIISLPWASPISFSHDSNGNLTGDSRRIFTYDDENRLTRVEVVGVWRTDFAYDGLGRRRWKKEYNGAGGLLSEVRYVYDGALVIEERDGNNNPLVTYARGLDLSGSLSGAGGIGGLLARSDANGIAYYHSDGSGNVTMLTDSNQTPVAKYIYDPFGNLLGMSGPLADANTYRFSSKEYHVNSGLYHFGARFYDPNLQRWTGRDPAGFVDGPNLYAFVHNGPTFLFDPWGLETESWWSSFGEKLGFIPDRVMQLTYSLRQGASDLVMDLSFLKDFIFNQGETNRVYSSDDRLTQLLKESHGADFMRADYLANSRTNGGYPTMQGYQDLTIGGGFTNAAEWQVGGFDWTATQIGTDQSGNPIVKFNVENKATLRSLFGLDEIRKQVKDRVGFYPYPRVPDLTREQTPVGGMIQQQFSWTETLKPKVVPSRPTVPRP